MVFSSKDLVDRINKTMAQKKIQKEPDFYKVVPSGTFSAWKNKEQIPLVITVCNIAEFLDVSLDYLLLGKEPMSLNEGEKTILSAYNRLNEMGKEAAIGAVEGLFPRFPLPSTQAGIKVDFL